MTLKLNLFFRNKIAEDEEMSNKLMAIVEDEEKVAEILETARTSMGMDISDLDLMNIERCGHYIVKTIIFVFRGQILMS